MGERTETADAGRHETVLKGYVNQQQLHRSRDKKNRHAHTNKAKICSVTTTQTVHANECIYVSTSTKQHNVITSSHNHITNIYLPAWVVPIVQ